MNQIKEIEFNVRDAKKLASALIFLLVAMNQTQKMTYNKVIK